jgi:hypothetical protein
VCDHHTGVARETDSTGMHGPFEVSTKDMDSAEARKWLEELLNLYDEVTKSRWPGMEVGQEHIAFAHRTFPLLTTSLPRAKCSPTGSVDSSPSENAESLQGGKGLGSRQRFFDCLPLIDLLSVRVICI